MGDKIENVEWLTGLQCLKIIFEEDAVRHYFLNQLLIPMYANGFIEGFKNGMFEVLDPSLIQDDPEKKLVDVDGFMIQNVDIHFCEKLIKYL